MVLHTVRIDDGKVFEKRYEVSASSVSSSIFSDSL
jgi:hypothetical protein